ncbi:MAG: aspartyl protease family protein [Nitrososphaerales archaeon]
MTYAEVRIWGSAGRSKSFNLLVDTGSVFTWIDGEALKDLGTEPSTEKKKFRTIEGREILRNVGEAKLELNGEKATSILVFAEKGDASVLGVHSLEGLGFEIDPVGKKLKKLEAFTAY